MCCTWSLSQQVHPAWALEIICLSGNFTLGDQGSAVLLWFVFWVYNPLAFMSAHNIPHASICGIICDHGLGFCHFYIMTKTFCSSLSGQCSGPQLSQHMERPFHSLVIRLISLANWHLFLSLKEAMFQPLSQLSVNLVEEKASGQCFLMWHRYRMIWYLQMIWWETRCRYILA